MHRVLLKHFLKPEVGKRETSISQNLFHKTDHYLKKKPTYFLGAQSRTPWTWFAESEHSYL